MRDPQTLVWYSTQSDIMSAIYVIVSTRILLNLFKYVVLLYINCYIIYCTQHLCV